MSSYDVEEEGEIMGEEELFGGHESDDSFGICRLANERLFRQIRVELIMNVHKVTEDVAVMMVKANDMPKRKGE